MHGERLPREQYERRGRQYQCFQRLVVVYETEPANIAALASLMQEAQHFGAPPAEIIAELAPGMSLGADGAPSLRGLPRPGGAAGGECGVA